MYENAALKSEKMPYEQEMALKIYNEIATMDHQGQVKVFCYLRGIILQGRKEQQEAIRKAIDANNQELELHEIGSKTIASGL